jgi:arylsulfatase A-like enzyme
MKCLSCLAGCWLALLLTSLATAAEKPAAEKPDSAKQTAAKPAAAKPNFLFLFADDYSYEAVRAFGHTDIDTPNLDRLARRGTTFTHAYNMGSYSPAVCVASRTMLVTGRSVWRAKEIYDKTDKERVAGRLWPQLMHDQGYRTFLTGKWHIKADATKAFDLVKHVRAGMPQDRPTSYNRPRAGQPDVWSPFDTEQAGYWTGGKHWSEVTADDAVDYLHAPAQNDQPFFMYVAFNAPHDPRQSPREYVERYPLSRIKLPTNYRDLYPHAEQIGAGTGLRDEKLAPFPRTEHAVKVHRQEYYAIITHLDAQIGRILDALEKSGQDKNTWIVFTADHGLACGHHGLLGKQNMYEHSLRVPYIVVGPGVEAGRQLATPIYLQDTMATALELAGAPKPAHVEFQSILPLLRGETKTGRDDMYGSYLNLQRAVIHDGWKLIVYPQAKVTRLYHVANDPDERQDLNGSPEQAQRKQALFARLLKLQQELSDPLDLQSTFPELASRN